MCLCGAAVVLQLAWSALSSAGVPGTGNLLLVSAVNLAMSLAAAPQLTYVALKGKSYRLDLVRSAPLHACIRLLPLTALMRRVVLTHRRPFPSLWERCA
jgi:hypothetical protein